MRKVYLLITAALLLLSSSAFAEVIAKVGNQEFDTDAYENYNYVRALWDASKASTAETPAVIQKNFTLENAWAPYVGFIDLNGYTIESSIFTCVENSSLEIFSSKENAKIESSTTGVVFWVYGSTESSAEKYSVLTIGENVTVNAKSGYGIVVEQSGSSNKSYGVEVHVDGNVNAEAWALDVSGNVKASTGNVPQIFVSGALKSTGAPAAYAGGYANWHFNGAEIEGTEGIYAKSGRISVVGGSVKATGAFVKDVVADCNGQKDAGDAIFMETNSCYAGGVFVEVLGDSKIESTNGYAIREAIINGTTSTATGISITGENTMLAGAEGSVQMTDDFKDAMIDGSSSTYEWVLNGISGGVYSSLPTVVADGYVAQEIKIGGKTYYTVVPKPEEPVAPASQTTYIINDSEWNYAVELTNSAAIVVKTGATFKIKGINVNRADANDVSKVTVEPGGKLIVGSNGIQTNSAEGLELLSGENGMGMLLYDGSTTATSPLGTANLYVYSKNIEGGDRIWQHFGIPTQAAPAITKAVPASFNNWDVKKGWVWDGGSATLTEPWVGHNLSVNSDEPGQIIKFAGQLVGNEDATLTLNKYGYNAFANSYTAPVNLKSIVDEAVAMDACTDGAVWVYSAAKAISTGVAKFDSYGADTSEDAALDPMQAFFILHESSSTDNIVLSYNEAVLGQNTRGADASSYNKATFTVTANGEADDFTIYEGEQFSPTSIDKGYDIKQMNHGFIKIFAKQNDENYAKIATNDAEGVELYIETKQAGEYKLSFSNISEGYKISLVDIVTETEVEVAEGNVYTFSVDENTTVKRFRFGKSQVSAEEANAEAVKIWANDGAIFVANNAAEANIEIINLSGVVVATAAASGEALQTVPVAGLASGVYVVRVGTATAKVVK